MNKIFIILLSACLTLCWAGCQATPVQQTQQEQQIVAAAESVVTASPLPEQFRQSGNLDMTLLSGAELSAVATGYAFEENTQIRVAISAQNDDGNPATIWLQLSGINGWDVRSHSQAVTAIHLAPGEQKEAEAVFDLTNPLAQYLRIGAIRQLVFVSEGYVDSSNYEFTMVESVIDVPDAPQDYTQRYFEDYDLLLQNEYLTIAKCSGDPADGPVVLYYEVTTPKEDAACKLYPIENGLYDTQTYPVLDEQSMEEAVRRLILFTPADPAQQGRLDGFFAVAQGVDMQPEWLPLNQTGLQAEYEQALEAFPALAQGESVCIRYDAQSKRFFAQGQASDRVFLLNMDESFTLNGRSVRANPQSILCFPGFATAFRVSGRGADDTGTVRSVTIDGDAETLSANWSVDLFHDGISDPTPWCALTVEDGKLAP